ncbi:MAG: hypothetical protein QXS90_03040, partial [Candidatus Diapherotrites archaeon]
LLILVTSIFAIVSFFALSLNDITKSKESSELVTRVKEKVQNVAMSSTFCDSTTYFFPQDIRTARGKFYYVVKISSADVKVNNKTLKTMIFSVYQRDEIKKEFSSIEFKAKAISADSFRTDAEIKLYNTDYLGSAYSGSISEKNEIFIDPQAENPINAITIIKEIKDGQKKIYVIACESALCEPTKEQVKELKGSEFNC